MKKTFKILSLFLLFSINVNCQVTTIIPLDQYDYPDGAYLKDLDNELPFYVGTWEGVLNSKKYTFEFVKFTQHLFQYEPGGDYSYSDIVCGKFKVVDLVTGVTLYDNLAATAYEDYNLLLLTLRGTFLYLDTEHCNNCAEFKLFKVPNNPNQLHYNQFRLTEYDYSDCPYQNQADIPMFMPTGDLILTRQ